MEHITLGIYSDEEEKFVEGTGKDIVGRLAIKGEMIFKGYWKQEDVYQDTVKDGWMITNDLVWRDEDDFSSIPLLQFLLKRSPLLRKHTP